jgi:hypothetical protein
MTGARGRSRAAAAVALAVLLAAALAGRASELELTGAERHPRDRFPLAVHVAATGDPARDAAARRAIGDWNATSRTALGVAVFAETERAGEAHVRVSVEPRGSSPLMGAAHIRADRAGVIELPVRVVVFVPEARGQTSAAVVFYQVVAHELGHALGLPHTAEARSIMCCTHGAIDFTDPVARQAYIDARRNPDVGSARAQLSRQYGAPGR